MADRATRPILRAGDNLERRPALGLVAPSGEILPISDGARRLVAPERAPIIISDSRDLVGITPRAWLAVAAFYCALAGIAAFLDWRAVPPEPWPDTPAVFTVVFEQPPPAPPEPEASPPPPQTAAAPPEPSPPEPPPEAEQPPPPEPLPPVAEKPPPVAEKPLPPETADIPPPPSKPGPPRVRRMAAAKPVPAPSAPAPAEPSPAVSGESAPKAPAEAQVAALPIVPPRAITGLASNRKPDYPAEARRRGIQGNVLLRVDVSAAGAALRVSVRTSSGHDMLDNAALRAVEQWRFAPATQGGIAVAGAVDVPVHFRLEE